jgi:hypothetical protein
MGEHIRHGAFEEILHSRLGPNDPLDNSEEGFVTLVVIRNSRIATSPRVE